MKTVPTYIPRIRENFSEEELMKESFLVILHATRIPPHIGLFIDGHYHSLSIKGHDDLPVGIFIRSIKQRKIPCLFVKIRAHDTFSRSYLREHFITNVQQFKRVEEGIATCMSPVRLFFNELYAVRTEEINYLYELLPVLENAGIAGDIYALFLEGRNYRLPFYTDTELMDSIRKARAEANALFQQIR